jgi:hypothetical protein
MITTGNNIPEVYDEDIYYNESPDEKGEKKAKGLRDFHNLVVKNRLINSISKPGDILIDYAVGRGGDIPKWNAAKLAFIFGIDFSKDNIESDSYPSYEEAEQACLDKLIEICKNK